MVSHIGLHLDPIKAENKITKKKGIYLLAIHNLITAKDIKLTCGLVVKALGQVSGLDPTYSFLSKSLHTEGSSPFLLKGLRGKMIPLLTISLAEPPLASFPA